MKFDRIKERMTSRQSKKTAADLGIILLAVTVIVLAAYWIDGIYPFGDASIARGDMVQQTIPGCMYYVWDILHGKASPFFTWDSGLGMNISGAASLGALLSPLNLLFYFCSRSYVYYFANFIVILKMIAIAYAMYFYLRKYKTHRMVSVVGGIVYAFGAASLVHFQIMMIMEIAFMLPLIMMALDRMHDQKKCTFFIVIFTWAMIVNVYTACITLVFVFLSSGIRNYFESDLSKAERKQWILRLGLSVAASLLLSAVVTIPALRCISETPRSGDGNFWNTYLTALQAQWSEYDWNTVERMCVNIALPFACIIGFLAAGKGKFADRIKKYKGQILLTACMLLSVVIPSIELLWHGGSRASWPVRFIYLITFVLVDFAVRLVQDNMETTGKEQERTVYILTGAGCAAACIIAARIFGRIYDAYCSSASYGTWGDGIVCLLIEALFVGLFIYLLKSHKNKIAVVVLLCVQLVCTTTLSYAPNKDNASVFSYQYLEAANNVGKGIRTEIGDFERIKNTDYQVDHIDYALVMGQEAISNYWHVISSKLQPNLSALGYSINWTQLLDAGGTIFSDTLLHIQYDLSYREMPEQLYTLCEKVKENDEQEIGLYKNNLEMPFAIQTDTASLDAAEEKFATQNALFQTITGSGDSLITDVSSQISGNSWTGESGKGKKVLYFYGTNSSEQQVSINVNGNLIYIPSSGSSEDVNYPADFGNGFICLGAFENETVSVQFSGNTQVDDSSLHLGWLDYDMLCSAVENINSQNPETVSLKQTHTGLRLQLDNVTKSHVFLPVSYDEGWECKVNGKKVDVQSIDGMVSVPVEQGSNKIVLKYHASGRSLGMTVSLMTLLVCVAAAFAKKKKKTLPENLTAVSGSVAYEIFAIVFVVFMAVMFVVPILRYLRGIFIIMQQ